MERIKKKFDSAYIQFGMMPSMAGCCTMASMAEHVGDKSDLDFGNKTRETRERLNMHAIPESNF